MHTEFLWDSLREREHLENLEENQSIILKQTFTKWNRGPQAQDRDSLRAVVTTAMNAFVSAANQSWKILNYGPSSVC